MKKKTYNSKLKTELKALTIRATDYYEKVFRDIAQPVDDIQRSVILFKVEPEIKKLGEYQNCLETIKADKKVDALLNKLVGTLNSRSNIGDADNVLRSFLAQYYFRHSKFDESSFDQNYAAFEELFYKNKIRLKDYSELYNLEMDIEEVDFGDGLKIVRRTRTVESSEDMVVRHKYQPYTSFSRSNFIIQRRHSKEKIVGDVSVSSKKS